MTITLTVSQDRCSVKSQTYTFSKHYFVFIIQLPKLSPISAFSALFAAAVVEKEALALP